MHPMKRNVYGMNGMKTLPAGLTQKLGRGGGPKWKLSVLSVTKLVNELQEPKKESKNSRLYPDSETRSEFQSLR